MRVPKFTVEEAKAHAYHYASVLQNVIDRCRLERQGNNWDIEDINDAYGDDLFNAVWRCSSSFPSDPFATYQAAMYIGYLRGKNDVLDVVGRCLSDELKETFDPVVDFFDDGKDE